jgi:hypothetical protein
MSGAYSPRVRRWATLLVIHRMLRRAIQGRKRLLSALKQDEISDQDFNLKPLVTLSVADIFAALYPVAASPIVLPYENGGSLNREHGWVRNLLRLRQDAWVVPNQIGDLALSIADVLAGRGWSPEEKAFGLRPFERQVLRGLVLDDKELTESDWMAYPVAANILTGSSSE